MTMPATTPIISLYGTPMAPPRPAFLSARNGSQRSPKSPARSRWDGPWPIPAFPSAAKTATRRRRRNGRSLAGRDGSGARLSEQPGFDGPTIRRDAGRALLSLGRSGPLDRRWPIGACGAHRPPDQVAWTALGTGRDRTGAPLPRCRGGGRHRWSRRQRTTPSSCGHSSAFAPAPQCRRRMSGAAISATVCPCTWSRLR